MGSGRLGLGPAEVEYSGLPLKSGEKSLGGLALLFLDAAEQAGGSVPEPDIWKLAGQDCPPGPWRLGHGGPRLILREAGLLPQVQREPPWCPLPPTVRSPPVAPSPACGSHSGS